MVLHGLARVQQSGLYGWSQEQETSSIREHVCVLVKKKYVIEWPIGFQHWY
jgi:hypothetical protein